MSNEQYSPWANGDGFGVPSNQPQPSSQGQSAAASGRPTSNYENPRFETPGAEPLGWSEPQQFGALQPVNQAPYPPIASFGQRMPYGPDSARPEHPSATTSLVLGIVGMLTLFVGFPFISPVAWFVAGRARREMLNNPGMYRHSSAITAGYVLGMVGTLIALAFVALIVLAIVLFVSAA